MWKTFALFCFILLFFYYIILHYILFYFILFYFILFYFILFYFILFIDFFLLFILEHISDWNCVLPVPKDTGERRSAIHTAGREVVGAVRELRLQSEPERKLIPSF